MDEYIKREEAIAWFMPYVHAGESIEADVVISDLKCMKAYDVEPVKRGWWEPVLEGVWNLPTPVLVGWRCSQCGRIEQEKEPYCNCGAKMNEEVDHD